MKKSSAEKTEKKSFLLEAGSIIVFAAARTDSDLQPSFRERLN